MTTALSAGLTASIRAQWASTASAAEMSPLRIASAIAGADHCQIGPAVSDRVMVSFLSEVAASAPKAAARPARGAIVIADFAAVPTAE